MRRIVKNVKMNPGSLVGRYGMSLIIRKNNSFQFPGIDNEITKNQALMRTALRRALRN